MKLIDVSCYNCGLKEYTPYATENGFSLVKCSHCGLLFVTPRPADDELATAHECGVHKGQDQFDMTGCWDESKVPRYLTALDHLYGNKLQEGCRDWLDIGCGHGEFLTALK